jgi:hypothetical protein
VCPAGSLLSLFAPVQEMQHADKFPPISRCNLGLHPACGGSLNLVMERAPQLAASIREIFSSLVSSLILESCVSYCIHAYFEVPIYVGTLVLAYVALAMRWQRYKNISL